MAPSWHSPTRHRRFAAGMALGAVIASGIAMHLLPDSVVTDVAGDALYALAAYAGLVLLLPRLRSPIVAGIAAASTIAIELFQLTGVPLAAGRVFPPVVLVLGTGFDVRDLVVYLLAVLVALAADAGLSGRASRDRPSGPDA